MTVWEYCNRQYLCPLDDEAAALRLDAELSALALQGWELCNMCNYYHNGQKSDVALFIFKRPRPQRPTSASDGKRNSGERRKKPDSSVSARKKRDAGPPILPTLSRD